MESIRFAAVAMLGAAVFGAPPADLKLDEVIRKSVEAQGGLEKIRAIKTVKMTGKMIVGGGPTEAAVVAYMKRPNLSRTELSVQGQKIVDGFDGTTKWTINPLMGIKEPQKANEGDTRAADGGGLWESPLVDFKEKGNAVELLGKEELEGSTVYKIKVTLKGGGVQTIYLNERTFLAVKVVSKVQHGDQEVETEMRPSDYKAVEGVQFPFASEMKVNKQSGMQLQFDKVEANVPMDDSIFAMPDAKPDIKQAIPPKTL